MIVSSSALRSVRAARAAGLSWFTTACLLLFCLHAWASPPQRVMSINLCTDQLLLDLLPPERITSVTFLSRDQYESYLNQAAWRVGINHGTPEEVVREKPDLVLAGTYTTSETNRLLRSVGFPVLELAPANSFQDIRDQTRQLGQLLGADAQAERLIQAMDANLRALAATAPKQPLSIVSWQGGSSVPGRGTLIDAIFTAAGAINLGASPGLRPGHFDAEQLLLLHPTLLATGDASVATPSLQNAPLQLPPIHRLYAGREIVYPELLYSCGLPQSADAAVHIRRTMLLALQGMPPT